MVSNMDRIENINEKINELNNEINEHIDNLYEHAEKDMDNIIQLLILNKTVFDENSFRESLKKYLEKYHRILYSSFSNKVFEWSKTENNYTDNAIVNLSSTVNKIEINNFEKEDSILLKMLDHIQLAIHQVEMMELSDNKIEPYLSKSVSAFDKKITDQVKEVNNSISSQTKKINDLKNSVKKDIEAQKDSLMSQMIAIVAIFVGISFVMFGGMSLINDLFTHVDGQPVPLVELICLGCLIGIVMIVVMYCFIMFILSITRNKMLRAKKIFFKIVLKTCTILGMASCVMFIIWCCQTFLK